MESTKDLNYYKNNCEEDYINTPISVLRYITELEQALQLQQTGVIKSLPDYELEFCKKCFQMTNHLSNKCQKCKGNV